MANLQKIYSDIDYTFMKKPVGGDIALSYDTQAVIRSIRNLILTRKYEVLWNPESGSNVDLLLFENFSPSTATSIENEIRRIIETSEPRVKLRTINVVATPDENAYNVSVSFFMENATQATNVTLLLERNR
jgi:phage baseplate assembly protein W